MKRIFTLLTFVAMSVTAMYAQNLSVKGTVYDFDSADPMPSANVSIIQIAGTDSTFIGGAATEDDGSFVVGNLKAGNYVARVSFTGYDDAYKNRTPEEIQGTLKGLGELASGYHERIAA